MIKKFSNHFFRKFLFKLLAFFVVVFCMDRAIGSVLKKFYYRQTAGYDHLTTYSINQTTADILIFGSSRAFNIFDPDIFEKRMGLSCYNLGRVGEPVFYHYAVLKAVLNRHKPELVLLSIDAGNFSRNEEAYDRLAALLPYYDDHPEIREVVNLKGRYERLKLQSKIYPYNSLVLPILTGNTEYNKKKYPHNKGFMPLNRTFSGPLQKFDYSAEKELDSVKINIYRSFIKDCINTGVRLEIICPPYLVDAVGTDKSIKMAGKIAQEYNIPFYDYSRDTFFTRKPHLFADYRHLNADGVEFFSNIIIDSLQRNQR